MKKAVVLCSGGIDSTTIIAIAKKQNFVIYALSFNYNQKNLCELYSAEQVAIFFNVEKHLILDIDFSKIGGSTLVGKKEFDDTQTYVPARNTVFLSLALAWAESLKSRDIFIGIKNSDPSGISYPDTTQKFIKAFEKLANVATKIGNINIHAPLFNLSKAETIKKGLELGVDYSITHSCYNPHNTIACGSCKACIERKQGFGELGKSDPIQYQGEPRW